jgi:hypothetical protein
MSDMSGPPFRADHVGSLLRPPEFRPRRRCLLTTRRGGHEGAEPGLGGVGSGAAVPGH